MWETALNPSASAKHMVFVSQPEPPHRVMRMKGWDGENNILRLNILEESEGNYV